MLIKKLTYHELLFKSNLDKLNIKYTLQKALISDKYCCIVDFYIHKPYKLCIEIDGDYHNNTKQKLKDNYKDNYIISRGYNILRIKNNEVENFNYNTLINN